MLKLFEGSSLLFILLQILGGSIVAVASDLQQPQDQTPVLFIHGFKGSTLTDDLGREKWIGAAQALGFSTPPLNLPLAWNQNGQKRDGLTAGKVLSEIRVIPGILSQEVYAPWIDAQSAKSYPFYSFTYDWRRDPLETLVSLNDFVNQIYQANHHKKIKAVGHSMGGLLLFAALNQNPKVFKSIVFAGVPFAGGIGFLLDMHVGTSVGLNKNILSPNVLFSFPSVYSFFSLSGIGLLEKDGTPLAMNFFSVKHWKDKKLGIFTHKAQGVPNLTTEQEQFLTVAVERAHLFRQLLVAKEVDYPPIYVVSSRRHATLHRVIHDGPQSIRGWDFESAPKNQGDGRVSEGDTHPPNSLPYSLIDTEFEHAELLNDPRVIQRINEL